jgi:hypothetical protein
VVLLLPLGLFEAVTCGQQPGSGAAVVTELSALEAFVDGTTVHHASGNMHAPTGRHNSSSTAGARSWLAAMRVLSAAALCAGRGLLNSPPHTSTTTGPSISTSSSQSQPSRQTCRRHAAVVLPSPTHAPPPLLRYPLKTHHARPHSRTPFPQNSCAHLSQVGVLC